MLAKLGHTVSKTGRCWFRLSNGGENYGFLFSNCIDSTYDDGSISRANDVGGEWRIDRMRVGLCGKLKEEPATWKTVTFGGCESKLVTGPEVFVSDPVELGAQAGDLLCYEITLTGDRFPYHEEVVLTLESKHDGAFQPDKQFPIPLMIGSDRPVHRKIGFFGDSITQGCGTEDDSFTHWVAQIDMGLPEAYSVWDLGIGYARAQDAASNGGWLERAGRCDTVHVCFGVNDLLRGRSDQEILQDLEQVITCLKDAGCKVILLTLPPFDLEGNVRKMWAQTNQAIRSELWKQADGLFDIAQVLGHPAPNEHQCRYGGHPDETGCRAVAEAYLAQNLL